jgi:hypothetical protein
VHRACFTAGGQCRAQAVEQPLFEGGRSAVGVAAQQLGDHPLVIEEIARGHRLIALGVGVHAKAV